MLVCAVMSGIWVGSGQGQQGVPPPSEGGYTLRVDSRIVVLDVVVHDKSGATVKHLTKDDFSVFEDKVPQRVKSFEEMMPPAAGSVIAVNSTAELDRLEPSAPVSILVLDELTTSFADLAFARYSLQKYLKAQGDTLEQPTMLMAVNYTNVAVLRDYTTSRKEILDAVDRHMASINSVTQAKSPSWVEAQMQRTFSSLVSVATATAGHPGHKNMIWVGRGFPSIDPSKLTAEENAAFQKVIASCSNILRDSRVTLYAVDPAGLVVEPPPQDEDGFTIDPFSSNVDFDTMAAATGGKSLHGRNDVDKLIGKSVEDGASFYTMSYTPTGATEDAKPFRNIRVVMKDKSLEATTREGYFAKAGVVEPVRDAKGKFSQRLVFDINNASASLLVYDGVPLTVERDPAVADRFLLHMRGSSLQVDGNGMAELTVVLESFDKKGKMLKRSAHQVTLRPGGAAVTLPETIATEAPAARVRFVVRDDGSGKVGAENFFLVDRKMIKNADVGR